jgi:hypothetical protein
MVMLVAMRSARLPESLVINRMAPAILQPRKRLKYSTRPPILHERHGGGVHARLISVATISPVSSPKTGILLILIEFLHPLKNGG